MIVSTAIHQHEWDTFLSTQPYRPFLQSWTMGEVYDAVGQPPVRLMTSGGHGEVLAICFGHIVAARRGRHLSIPYGPILASSLTSEQKVRILTQLMEAVKDAARSHDCAFIRMSPLWPASDQTVLPNSVQSPLHLLAEHVWYLPLQDPDPWSQSVHHPVSIVCGFARTEDSLLSAMRKTTRNLIRRAERDGVTVTASQDPVSDLGHFLRLHEETRKRHGFTAYTDDFFRAQVERFSKRSECTLYLARYQGDIIAASIHMHVFGETSYHHGASSMSHARIPASYLLQWTAIRDALKRGDRIYNFWGIAPPSLTPIPHPHPFAGVTLFKTGFGGRLLNLVHCRDMPVRTIYWLTYGFEMLRKWRRGF